MRFQQKIGGSGVSIDCAFISTDNRQLKTDNLKLVKK